MIFTQELLSRVRSRARLAALALAVGVALLSPAVAQGNATPARRSPSTNGLVIPIAIESLRVVHERLTIDLTHSRSEPDIEAIYQLSNPSTEDVSLELLFLAPGTNALSVLVNGTPVGVERASEMELPREWLPIQAGIDPRTGEEYQLSDQGAAYAVTGWTFSASIPSGDTSTISARYRGSSGYDRARGDQIIHHLSYLLGPAQNWSSFGTLEVSATVPKGQILASKPPMQKMDEGDGVVRYGAVFDGLPSSILTVSTVALPTPWSPWIEYIGVGLPFIPGTLFGVLTGLLASRIRRWYLALAVGGTAAFLVTMLGAASFSMTVLGSEPLASAVEELSHPASVTYPAIFSALVLAPFFSSLMAAVWAAVGSRRRKQ